MQDKHRLNKAPCALKRKIKINFKKYITKVLVYKGALITKYLLFLSFKSLVIFNNWYI